MTTYLETGSTDPYFNLAFEEYVLKNRRDGDYLLLWQNDNTIVVGLNQNTEEEIDRDFVQAHGIHIVRRATGGGAVYHDLGNLNYSFITDCGGYDKMALAHFTEPVAAALRGLGLEAEVSGRNDILVCGKKVSGTAQRLEGGRILHHGTLLYRSNPDMVAGALRADPLKFRSKSTKSVRSRVGNIADYLPEPLSLQEFWAYLKKALAAGDFREDRMREEELAAVRQLREEKYAGWEWNYGRSPAYDRKTKQALPGGILETGVSVDRGGCIREVSFRGDFLSRRDASEVAAALTGLPCREAAVREKLSEFNLEDYFGAITAEELIKGIVG